MSKPEDNLSWQLQAAGIAHEREFRFVPNRRFRADYRIGTLLVEIEGGVHSGGRHVRGVGYIRDMEKYNLATLGGWRVLRFTPQQVNDGVALATIEQALKEVGE